VPQWRFVNPPSNAMASIASLSAARTTHALTGVLVSKGYEVADFQVDEEMRSDLSEIFGLVGGLLKVRCCSTGEERMYSTGLGSAWLGAFLSDLGSGHFAGAARRRTNPGESLLRQRYEPADRIGASLQRQ